MHPGGTGGFDGVILIGSSEPAFLKALSEFVSESFGGRVKTVDDSADLLLELIDKEVAIAIIDTNLKGLPAAKTVQVLRKCRPRVSVIVVSDDYSVATGSDIARQGVFYYTYKPVDMASIGEIIESAIRKRAREESRER